MEGKEEYEVTLMVGRARRGKGEERRGSTTHASCSQCSRGGRDRQPDALRRGTRTINPEEVEEVDSLRLLAGYWRSVGDGSCV